MEGKLSSSSLIHLLAILDKSYKEDRITRLNNGEIEEGTWFNDDDFNKIKQSIEEILEWNRKLRI